MMIALALVTMLAVWRAKETVPPRQPST